MRIRLLLLTFLIPFLAHAQGRPPAVVKKPYAVDNAKEFAFRTVEDDHGGFYLIWTHDAGGAYELIGQHIKADGQAMWKEPDVSLVAHAQPGSWDAVSDGKGGLLLAWINDGHAHAQRFGADQQRVWPAEDERVNASSGTQAAPSIAADGAGGAYIVWQERILPDRGVLFIQHRNGMGAALWPRGGIRVSLRPSNQRQPRSVFDGLAGVIVAWQDFRESASQLQTQRLDYQGNRLWGLEGVVLTAPAGDPDKPPYMGAVGKGSAVYAWQSSSSAANRIFMQLLDPTGKFGWSSQGLELSPGNWNEWNPVLHGDGEGGTWVGWEDFRNGAHWQVYVEHLQVTGEPGWPGGGVALGGSVQADQGRLSLADDGRQGILAAWVDNRYGTVGIYWQAVTPKGEVLLGPIGMIVADQLVDPKNPQIVALGLGEAVVAWADAPAKNRWTLHWKRVVLKS